MLVCQTQKHRIHPPLQFKMGVTEGAGPRLHSSFLCWSYCCPFQYQFEYKAFYDCLSVAAILKQWNIFLYPLQQSLSSRDKAFQHLQRVQYYQKHRLSQVSKKLPWTKSSGMFLTGVWPGGLIPLPEMKLPKRRGAFGPSRIWRESSVFQRDVGTTLGISFSKRVAPVWCQSIPGEETLTDAALATTT